MAMKNPNITVTLDPDGKFTEMLEKDIEAMLFTAGEMFADKHSPFTRLRADTRNLLYLSVATTEARYTECKRKMIRSMIIGPNDKTLDLSDRVMEDVLDLSLLMISGSIDEHPDSETILDRIRKPSPLANMVLCRTNIRDMAQKSLGHHVNEADGLIGTAESYYSEMVGDIVNDTPHPDTRLGGIVLNTVGFTIAHFDLLLFANAEHTF